MKVVWTLVAVAGLAGIAAVLFSWKSISMPENSGTVAAVSVLLSVSGIIVSLIGFTSSVQQIAKTRSASEASELALADIRTRLSALNATSDVERARLSLDAADKIISEGRWDDLRSVIAPARQAFVRIEELDVPIFDGTRELLSQMIIEMAELLDKRQLLTIKTFVHQLL